MSNRKITAVNWNTVEKEDIRQVMWNQNIQQFWTEEEIDLSEDVNTWKDLSKTWQTAYMRALVGLTQLDTEQGSMGMPLISIHTKDEHYRGVFSFMGTMEHIHARSYSSIFTTLSNSDKISEIFQWVEENELTQKKANLIDSYYMKLLTPNPSARDKYMAKVASVFLESYLFYSGFFLPFYLAGGGFGQDKYLLVGSSEIIKLIVRDEAVHSLFTGFVAQEEYEELSEQEQKEVDEETTDLMLKLYQIEQEYTALLYDEIGLTQEVLKYVRYNANRALMTLGKEAFFPNEEVNAIVLNGISTETANHDFFSSKGNGYVNNRNRELLKDEDFIYKFEESDPDFVDLDSL